MLSAFGQFNKRGGGGGGGVLSAFGRFNEQGGGGHFRPVQQVGGGGLLACKKKKKKKKSQYRLTVAVSGKIQCSIEDKRVVAHN